MKTRFLPLLAATLFAAPLHAQNVQPGTMQQDSMHGGAMMDGSTMQPNPMPNAPMQNPAGMMSDAVVRKIDPSVGRITLKHGPITNLDMPPMTMVFRVRSPELLNDLKAGDMVKFRAEEIGGNLTVTEIEKVQ
ncbi:MAG: copper-binding protein [Pseudomonadota bacterium]